jgi:chorismate-pyruvate lyase
MKNEWLTKEAFWDLCRRKPIDPILRLLLTSDGTLIRHLQSLFQTPVEVAIQEQREILIDEEQASWIATPAGEKGVQRKVWLTAGASSAAKSDKKVFAVSTFPLAGLKPDFHQEILLGEKPIGQIIEAQRLLTRRDRLEITRLPLPQIAEAIGRQPGELFWARRYRLTISNQVSGVIFEAFSPSLFSSSSYSP